MMTAQNSTLERPQWRLMPAEASLEMCTAVQAKLKHSTMSRDSNGPVEIYRTYVQFAPHPEPKLLNVHQTEMLVKRATSEIDLVHLVEKAVYANLGIDCGSRPVLDSQMIVRVRDSFATDKERAAFDAALDVIAGAQAPVDA
jgi:hypothetical protein